MSVRVDPKPLIRVRVGVCTAKREAVACGFVEAQRLVRVIECAVVADELVAGVKLELEASNCLTQNR